MGRGLGHVPPGEGRAVWGAGGHRGIGTVLPAAASSHTSRHGGGGNRPLWISTSRLFDVGSVREVTCLCCWQDNAGNRMKGFKYLLQAAEAGDRSSMIIVARAFDTGINLSADR